MFLPVQDSHIHLKEKDSESFFERILSDGGFLFCNAVQSGEWEKLVEMSAMRNFIPFIGIHPWFILDIGYGYVKKNLNMFLSGSYCGVGEIGLDKIKDIDFSEQKKFFSLQVELAKEYGRPVSVHSVRAWSETFDILRNAGEYKVPFLIHSFNYSKEISKKFLDLGGYISLGITDFSRRPGRFGELVKYVPIDRLFLESDFPYRLKENEYEEKMALFIGDIASILGISEARLKEVLLFNGKVFTDGKIAG